MWLIVVNSTAGKGKALILASQLIDLLNQHNLGFKLINEATYQKTNILVKNEISSAKYSKVVAIGGDGLVNLCLQYVAKTDVSLGVIAAGTGNDFARAVGTYKKSVPDIFSALKNDTPQRIDLGMISGTFGVRWYVQVLSTGFDALVNSLANKILWPRGKFKYTLATILTLAKFKPISYEIEVDGKQILQKAMLICIANGATYGGGMRICPDASNSDGVFDILLVRPVSKIVLLTIFPKVFSGNHIPHPKIDVFRGKFLRLSASTSAYADGEFVSNLPIDILNVQAALKTWIL